MGADTCMDLEVRLEACMLLGILALPQAAWFCLVHRDPLEQVAGVGE